MSDVAIRVENLSKRYRIGARQAGYSTIRETVTDLAVAPVRRLRRLGQPTPPEETIWALKDVSFEVKQGEVLGIIGPNGSGKTTLLKVLSRITEPTEGQAGIHGRVGSLLEVGTGFHPELTGRENIYLNGAILGMKRTEIETKFDEIVDFAEIEKFLDTPVKRYSSGMYVRLAFAVAAHLEPEILLVDEVLAVGDAAFQKKCLGKMGDVAKQGRTVLFVSHNMAAVKSLCQRAILLDRGREVRSGLAEDVVQSYLSLGAEVASGRMWPDPEIAPGNSRARVRAVRILDAEGKPVDESPIESAIVIEIQYVVLQPDTVLNLSISLFSQEDIHVLASASVTDSIWFQRAHPVGCFVSRCDIPGALLNEGRYSVTALLVENGYNVIAQLDRVVSVDLVDLGGTRGGYFGYWGGVVRPTLRWETKCM